MPSPDRVALLRSSAVLGGLPPKDVHRLARLTATVTAPGCPLHEVTTSWMREVVTKLPGVERVDVTLTFDPPWTPSGS